MFRSDPLRAAVYARYSSDLQSPASITDQIRLCRRFCEEHGWTVVEVFSDEAMSGASHLRPQFQQLQQVAMQGRFDILVAESLDRLSRDQEHIAGLHKRMRFLGVGIHTKAEGEINEMHIGLGGTMSALFLRQLAQKTHRGLEGRVRQGKSAGGLSFGYRLDRNALPDGSLTTGDLVIEPTEAAIVRHIFERFAAGESARAIAFELNERNVPAPRAAKGKTAGTWSFSTISGNRKRGTGILNNELYIGRRVWNRQRFIKDPSTGKRQARPNPPEQWVIEDVPDLRIIDDDLWGRAKEIQEGVRAAINADDRPNAFGAARRPTHLFSGLLKCACCGANYILVNKVKYGCSAARNRGTCANRALIRREEIEARVLEGLKAHLLHPDLIAEFVAEFQQEMRKEQRSAEHARKTSEQRLAQIDGEIENLVNAIMAGMFHASMKERLDELEAEQRALQDRLSTMPTPDPVIIHPAVAEIYRSKVEDLTVALNDSDSRSEATAILRGLIEQIVLHPDPDAPSGHVIELYGELGAILGLGDGTNDKPRLGLGGVSNSLVAGVGFEPTTFRL
ncbi:recombinase family protein [Thioclava sp. F28-4]|uniref:recombinase family protein n=1 Tax=Thioclava sp. F28-4 TaxID=1915315 RepID=UPI00099878AF|nr:recombinase family protein [Thioclava sp. F28-4]OOY02726.1 resolvase [Thioclava sp. F28-4]